MIRIQNNIRVMEKNMSLGPQCADSQPEYKKIQDYIYKFSDQIGMGNFSKVFRGVHQVTGKPVAIKIVELHSLNTSRLQELLNTQTKILKTLSHPNVIGCEEILSSLRNCYIVMELCTGGDLEKRLRKSGPVKEKELYAIALDVYEGLKYLAKKHIVHRDIKISNIFINNGVHKIADFGFAQASQVQFRDISVGSPIYMSPQGYINNMYGPKTDVWAFGVMLFELIEGRTPCSECRSEIQLRNCLMKQVEPSSINAQVSSELKSLIIQCLDINVSSRISIADIEKNEWMKKACKWVADGKKLERQSVIMEKPIAPERPRKPSETISIPQASPKNTASNKTSATTAPKQDALLKNYSNKFQKMIKKQDKEKQQASSHRRKHSTLDKANKLILNDEPKMTNDESDNVFYSPKNILLKLDRQLGLRNCSPKHKFDPIHLKTEGKEPKLQGKTTQSNQALKYDSVGFNKLRNMWAEEKSQRDSEAANFSERIEKQHNKQKEKNHSNFSAFHNTYQQKSTKQPRDELKQIKRNHKLTLTGESNFFNVNLRDLGHNPSLLVGHEKSPKASHEIQNKQRLSQFIQAKILRTTNMNKFKSKEEEKARISKEIRVAPVQQKQKEVEKNTVEPLPRILTRPLRFGDSISLIHYCRLCYKFACLLDEYGDAEQARSFLTAWSIQLLQELKGKIERADIIFSHETSLINNPSINPYSSADNEKKKKLKDVTEQYLNKYISNAKHLDKNPISLKEASSFIYNLYLVKGHEFKQRAKEKKSHLEYALICYVSTLDKETRNLMEFGYEMKNALEGRAIEKLLNIKISEFTRKHIEEIISENVENAVGAF